MANKQVIDLEANLEMMDLTLKLGTDKGKRPLDESTEEQQWKRFKEETEYESTARSSENKLARLEEKMENLEKALKEQMDKLERKTNKLEADLKLRADRLEKKIENHFLHTNTCLYCQHGKNLEYFHAISGSLETIIRCLNGRAIAPLPLQSIPPRANAPSSSRAPSSSKGPQE